MIIQVFNRYLHHGGEEASVERIRQHIKEAGIEVENCYFDSADWKGETAPSVFGQARRMFYNKDSAERLECEIDRLKPQALLVHNVYPVASPAVYEVASRLGVPVIQYVHNFRPFSVGGTLYAKGVFCDESLTGNFMREIRLGAWQDSVIKSALMALNLKRLIHSGHLDNVKAWVCVSDYMAEAFTTAGVEKSRIHVLRHSWDVTGKPSGIDCGFYLFLGRLVEEKGVLMLLETWERLEKVLGDKTPVLKIGGEGPLEEVVKQKSLESKHIEHLGFVEGVQKTALLSECRAMMAPSLWKEPLGLVAYEAQEHGKAIFSAKSGGLCETTDHESTGFLHGPGDCNELMQQVVAYEATSDSERRELGVRAYDRLIKSASPAQWKKGFRKIYDSAIG